nr:transposon Ty3-I Gag-Pol polyprotein [Tanacetum cinerariifolium]
TPNPHIQSLLQSYNHVFPAEIPSGLPPLRTIQHKIEFLPGSVLHNKPAYHSIPQQTDEIRKQVDGLLQKGLIRVGNKMLQGIPTASYGDSPAITFYHWKFDAKGDEGYFVGYSLSSKAFRVFNKRTKKAEENLHVDFLENKLIEK